jgi:hypothetical protein
LDAGGDETLPAGSAGVSADAEASAESGRTEAVAERIVRWFFLSPIGKRGTAERGRERETTADSNGKARDARLWVTGTRNPTDKPTSARTG